MPEVCFFDGISITMNPSEHNPPHFHAKYAEFKALFDFNGEILKGSFPPKQTKITSVWAMMRNKELLNNWELLKNGKITVRIEPLK
ncbi:MAG: DUF4160 domain-containing protein [Chitinivibrionia bacterium]|nr:DUF4160 domain-containing protein [Chitinivibrionia bacterium]